MTVVTGPSGSGKSSLAFDTIYAEGQRRYVETFSPYMRQFLDRMDKPRVDEIRGIPPAIAIEQANPVKSSRSTVGTMTEINDYLKLLLPRIARAFCPGCGREIRPETAQSIADNVLRRRAFAATTESGSCSITVLGRARLRPENRAARISSISSSSRAICAFGSTVKSFAWTTRNKNQTTRRARAGHSGSPRDR